jgi:hypothetical protein
MQSDLSLFEKDTDIEKQFEYITRTILNARKVQIAGDEDEVTRNLSTKSIDYGDASNMVFELKNIDYFGRNLLHKFAFLHKSYEIMEILNTLFYKLKSEALPPVSTVDIFGNTALMLACIKRAGSENLND